MIPLEIRPAGIVLAVRAAPGSRRNEFRGFQDGALKLSVTQVAEKGKANAALRTELARALGLRKSQVELIAGQTTPQKKFLIREISVDDLRSLATSRAVVPCARENPFGNAGRLPNWKPG